MRILYNLAVPLCVKPNVACLHNAVNVRPVGVPVENVHRVRHLTCHFAEMHPILIPGVVVWCSNTL
jgi:hypothetical protein